MPSFWLQKFLFYPSCFHCVFFRDQSILQSIWCFLYSNALSTHGCWDCNVRVTLGICCPCNYCNRHTMYYTCSCTYPRDNLHIPMCMIWFALKTCWNHTMLGLRSDIWNHQPSPSQYVSYPIFHTRWHFHRYRRRHCIPPYHATRRAAVHKPHDNSVQYRNVSTDTGFKSNICVDKCWKIYANRTCVSVPVDVAVFCHLYIASTKPSWDCCYTEYRKIIHVFMESFQLVFISWYAQCVCWVWVGTRATWCARCSWSQKWEEFFVTFLK